MTPLIRATINNHKEAIELLIKYGANKEAIDSDNMTPLICAAEYGYKEEVDLLVQYGANIEAVGYQRKNALIFSITNSHISQK